MTRVKKREFDEFARKIAKIRKREQVSNDAEIIHRALRLYEFIVQAKSEAILKRAAERRRKKLASKRKPKRK